MKAETTLEFIGIGILRLLREPIGVGSPVTANRFYCGSADTGYTTGDCRDNVYSVFQCNSIYAAFTAVPSFTMSCKKSAR